MSGLTDNWFLSPNEYGCIYAWTTLGSGPSINLQRMLFFPKKIIFSDEAHFDLGGYIKKQNCRIWGTENPHAYIEKPTHSKRDTVSCGFWSRDIIGPFFFEIEQWEVVTINSDRYRAMLNEFWFTKIEGEDIGNIWFQQDGATCHTVETTLDVLRYFLENRISWCRLVTSELRFDTVGLYIYFYGAVIYKCYADKPETIDALKDNIREDVGEIQLHTIGNVLKNCTNRVGYSMATKGSHLNEIIFHY